MDLWSLPRADLKNTTDDALPNYLTSLKFRQSHFLTDIRLALGYSAVLIAAITFYADYKLGWDKTKAATFWAVLLYFTLNGALTFWIWGVEKGQVFTGEIDQSSTGRTLVGAEQRIGQDQSLSRTVVVNSLKCYEAYPCLPSQCSLRNPWQEWCNTGVIVTF